MLKQWIFNLRNMSRHLSVRAGFFALLAVFSSLAGVLFDEYVPDDWGDLVGGKAVDGILTMMASSMLIVVTFALSTMVAAYSSATQTAPPRATRLIKNDSESHSAISIFLGAFIYSIVSLIALSTGYYGEKGRVILLAMTVAVLSAVVWVIIKWVGELKNMGSVHESIKRVEDETAESLKLRAKHPTFLCQTLDTLPAGLLHVPSESVGHIKNIDISSLSDIAEKENLEIYLEKDIGSFVHHQSTIAYVRLGGKKNKDEVIKKIKKAFSIGSHRTFDSDPLYGIRVLSDIGVKALSPALNDPGTAEDVVGSLVRLLSSWERQKNCNQKENPKFARIYFPELKVEDLFNEAFYNLTKESMRSFPVIRAVKGGLEALSESPDYEFKRQAIEHIQLLEARVRSEVSLHSDVRNLLGSESSLVH